MGIPTRSVSSAFTTATVPETEPVSKTTVSAHPVRGPKDFFRWAKPGIK